MKKSQYPFQRNSFKDWLCEGFSENSQKGLFWASPTRTFQTFSLRTPPSVSPPVVRGWSSLGQQTACSSCSVLSKMLQLSSWRTMSACSKAGSSGWHWCCLQRATLPGNKSSSQHSSSPRGSNCCHLFPYKGYLNAKAGNHLFADHFATG